MKKLLAILALSLVSVSLWAQPIEIRRASGGIDSNYVATNFVTSNQFATYTNFVLTNFATSNALYSYTNTAARFIIAGTNIVVETNGVSFTINSTASGSGGFDGNPNQFNNANSLTNIISGAALTNINGHGTFSLSNLTVTNWIRQPIRTVTYTDATNVLISLDQGSEFYVLLTNTAHIAFTNFPAAGIGQTINLRLRQDGTGGRVVTFKTNTVFFASGVSPTVTTNAGARDLISGTVDIDGTNIIAAYVQNLR